MNSHLTSQVRDKVLRIKVYQDRFHSLKLINLLHEFAGKQLNYQSLLSDLNYRESSSSLNQAKNNSPAGY